MKIITFPKLRELIKSIIGVDPMSLPSIIKIHEPINPIKLIIGKDDGFELRGKRVIVYIEYQYFTKDYFIQLSKCIIDESTYKYHLAMCKTLKKFVRREKYHTRYIASDQSEEVFEVTAIDRSSIEPLISLIFGENIYSRKIIRELKMRVCKNCLKELNYKGYKYKSKEEKEKIYQEFSLERYIGDYQIYLKELGTSGT